MAKAFSDDLVMQHNNSHHIFSPTVLIMEIIIGCCVVTLPLVAECRAIYSHSMHLGHVLDDDLTSGSTQPV